MVNHNPKFTSQWFVKRGRGPWKEHLMPRAPFHSYLELGSYEGRSLIFCMKHLLHPDGIATAVDHWTSNRSVERKVAAMEVARENFWHNIAPYMEQQRPRLVVKEMPTFDFLMETVLAANQSFDLALVDADHHADTALMDMMLTWKLMRPGGIMICDDINLRKYRRRALVPKVQEAVEAFRLTHEPKVLYETIYQIGFVKQ